MLVFNSIKNQLHLRMITKHPFLKKDKTPHIRFKSGDKEELKELANATGDGKRMNKIKKLKNGEYTYTPTKSLLSKAEQIFNRMLMSA